ncbi:MAG: LPS export ABC transporter periplasmic protein LptC [Gammaproteobacteria bacterium]|nr:LPS export ABC transporter periplasmic protein LptC [Gammaproteobacteria bacterium]
MNFLLRPIGGNGRYGIALLALAVLAGLSAWLLQTTEKPQVSVPGKQRHDPDFYMKDFTMTTMDKAGVPRNRLSGPYLVHYADDDSAELTRPRMIAFRQDEPPWHIEAERGWISSGGKDVALRGEVVMRQSDAVRGREQTVRTTDLRVRPDDEYAETAHPVTFSNNAGSVVDAVGMRVSLKDERLELLSKVRATYVSQIQKN